MNFCPSCGHSLLGNIPVPVMPFEAPHTHDVIRNAEAHRSLTTKISTLAPTFDSLSEDEWGDWVDALALDEFLEMITLGNEGIGKIIAQANS